MSPLTNPHFISTDCQGCGRVVTHARNLNQAVSHAPPNKRRRPKPGAPRDCTGFTGGRPLEPSVHRLRLPVGSHRGVINMAGRYQGFHSLNTGNIEIFWRADGWCWWSRTPGCPSVSAPVGPFLTSTDAYLNANGGACLIPRPARLDRVA